MNTNDSFLKALIPSFIVGIYLWLFYSFYTSEEIICYAIITFFLFKIIFKIGHDLTIKEILLFILLLQYFLAPSVVYNRFNNDVGDFGYDMKIPKEEYFSFLIGAVIAITAGLFAPFFKSKIKTVELFNRIKLLPGNFNIGITLLVIGFLSHLTLPFLPSTFAFLGLFLTNLKYVGIFYIYFSNNSKKFIYIFIVIAYLVLNIVSGGVFIDLFIWGLFIATFFTINKKISLITKILFLIVGSITVLLIQSIKADYRKIIWDENKSEEVNEELVFIDLTQTKLENVQSIFEEDNLKSFFSRINQGWILSNVLDHVPQNQDFSHGDLFLRELKGIILPRVLAPDKVTASGKDVKEKFMKYTGRILHGNTTMNVGLISDGYINFGRYGCWIFMFFVGLFVNFFMHKIYQYSQNYPTLILWLPVLFFYLLRTANDFYMIMNYLVKSTMLLVVVFYIFKNVFYQPQIDQN